MHNLKRIAKHSIVVLGCIRFIPHLLCLVLSSKISRNLLLYDVQRWCKLYDLQTIRGGYATVWLLTFYKEFRSLFYYRIKLSRLFKFLAKGTINLYINCENIGQGLFIQHGFSTVISAKSIGQNCWINQQVTIGWTNNYDAPIIGNNVKIFAGAIIVGNVHVGDNAVIGAGTVVVKDVPPNTTIVGAPSRMLNK